MIARVMTTRRAGRPIDFHIPTRLKSMAGDVLRNRFPKFFFFRKSPSRVEMAAGLTQTDSEGEFEIGLLPPGQYTLNVRAEARQSFTQERLAVHAGRSVRIDLSIDPETAFVAPVRLGMQVPVLQASSAQGGTVVSRDC